MRFVPWAEDEMIAKTTTWRTKDGRVIPVSELAGPHLQNIICLLIKRLEKLEAEIDAGWGFLSTLRGEMSRDYAEGGLDNLEYKRNGITRWLRIMQSEQKTRIEGADEKR